ncbi:hypothetical protein NDU88_004512 [Pleurodeles waltl]|uniref:Uncharacterized protein n=1 Tax=Pleurodeles waltl TaxID=8319 RepID=A0AAV7UJF8_PLEWA|nr:hypothetical protein NDU88_004512 [Pleurodeles waltl]
MSMRGGPIGSRAAPVSPGLGRAPLQGGPQRVRRCPHSVAGSRRRSPGLGRFCRVSPAARPATHARTRLEGEEGAAGLHIVRAALLGPQCSPGSTRGSRRSSRYSAALPEGLMFGRSVPARWAGILNLAPPSPDPHASAMFGVLATPPSVETSI